ncbi:uncharacterized protein LOC123520093 isoform X5 [Portunus trituberculatus]|uniref:uncharacterized protein LOC123520093 isoform X5 n=1 Tax=Portunus trituberculatus TaxID=210409 RepID=UPI001E1D0813|nr:uncharacterized protein LOC123520093 isoform X5 [Portunus trituberculatus]
MPVAGGRVQKRVNERAGNHNLDPGSLHSSPAAHHDALQEVAGWHMEDWEELEALLESEHLILGQEQQQQQQQHSGSDINLLQSPERAPRLPPEAPASRSSSRRSLPRTRGGFSVPLHQLSSILLNMTFSDTEDDHQGGSGGRNTSNEQDHSLSRSRTESGVSNASTVSLASPSSSAGPAATSNGPAASGGAAGVDMVAAAQTASSMVDMTSLQSDIYARYVHLNKSLQQQEEEYLDILARSLVLNKAAAQVANGTQQSTAPSGSPAAQVNGRDEPAAEEGSRLVGMISTDNVRTMSSENVRSLQDRLAASQEESVAIMSQMRASIARREDLLTRYKATQERLANLKRQRQGIHEEKQRLLQQGAGDASASGDTAEGEEDPIPGAENWPLAEVTRALVDFQALLDKVERLTSVYSNRAQDMAADEEGQADINNKLSLLASRRRQLTDVVARLKRFQLVRQQEERDGAGEEGGHHPVSDAPAGTPDLNHIPVSNTHSGMGDETAPPSTLAASVPSVNGKGSVSSISQTASVRAAAESVSQASEELQSRKAQLSSLQKQLSDMKKMLDMANMVNMARQEVREQVEGACSLPPASGELEGAVAGEVLEVSGKKIVLTEAERQNPEIAAKYNQLSKAKERLAKMEEVITMISQARQSGQNLRDVLPQDYLAILEEAEEDFPDPSRPAPLSLPAPQRSVEIEEDLGRLSRCPTRPPRMGSAGRSETGPGLGRDSQESREISAMQQRLNKTSTRVSAVNERSRHGHEKGAIKKQPQALWQGNSGGSSSRGGGAAEDPRLAQVLALQEELRQKKNALEALMRRMGKSSSLNMDNISDNISDNVSDTSDHLGETRGTSGAATWGEAAPLHHFSDNHYQQSSDDDLIDEDEADLPPRSQVRPPQPPPPPGAMSPKDRNRHSASQHRRRQDSGRLSVNNLSATLPTPTRTKHNRLRSSSAPKALWESVGTPEGPNYKSPSNTTMQTQHSLNTALNQLNQVQGTINTLQESLRQEQSHVMGSSRASPYHPQLVPPLLPDLTPTSLPPVAPPSQALTPMSAYAGLGSLALASQGGGETINQQLLAGMQQCFSQLHLHSLEIQALSKHLQLLERREQTGSAAMADVGEGLCQGGRGAARRSEEEEEDEDNEEEDEIHGSTRPHYPHHHNLLANPSGLRPGKDGGAARTPQDSFSVFLRQQSEGGGMPSTGVTNPIYGHLGDLRDQAGSTWGSLAPTPGTEQPTDTLGSLLEAGAGAGTLEGSPSHPLLHLGRLGEEGSQSQAPEAHHWASLASTHPLHHQTTDLLNNQVPPGTRANNYWDNFRSYSRQNLLSTTTKSNTSDIHPPSTSSVSVPTHSAASALLPGREGIRGEDKRFNVSVGHNNTNCGAGARARMPNPHINNPQGATNPRVRNPVASSSKHLLGQNKHKANNRNKQTGDLWSASKCSERNLPSQERGSGGRNRGYLNYNSARANTSDSEGGGEGTNTAGVTLEVLREAEALIRRHANQPEFLLQLFRHASEITVHTDQHVAVALLHDLATQPHRPSTHGVNANIRGSSRRRAEGTTGLSLSAPLRDSWQPQPHHSHPQNTLPQENVSVVDLSGSEVSESGLTSEDEDNRALYRNVKNLSLSPGGAVAAPPAPPGDVNSGARPQYPQPPPLHSGPHYDHNYHDFPPHGHHNLSNPPTTQGGESTRSVANSESSLYDHLVFNDSHLASRQEVVEDWVRRGVEEEAGPSKLPNQPDTAGSSPEDAHNLIHPLNNDTEYLTFETLVASAVRESTEVLQAQACEDVASPLLLNSLHHSLVAHIQTRAQSLRLPQSFLFSTDTELKSVLQNFAGKPLAQVSSDVPSIISQVLLTQYCSVLVQRLRDNRPLLPQTPTKLSTTPLAKAGEMNLEGASATPTSALPECHPTQEVTTATQTEAAVFSLHPQRPSLHTGHNFSLTAGAAAIHPPPPPPAPESTPVESAWQAPPPPPAPLPSPNHNPGVGEPLSESAACGGAALPGAQSGVWGAEGVASPTAALGASCGEAEQEEAMMDDLGEPTLVHTLAEADQSQDAVEGDWGEDSQAEGIVQAEGGRPSCSSHSLPLSQHPGWLPSRDASSQLEMEVEVEGLVESDAAEAAALGVGHLLFMDQQSQELDEVPTKLQSPEGSSPADTPDQPLPQHHNNHHHHHHHHQQCPQSPDGSEG